MSRHKVNRKRSRETIFESTIFFSTSKEWIQLTSCTLTICFCQVVAAKRVFNLYCDCECHFVWAMICITCKWQQHYSSLWFITQKHLAMKAATTPTTLHCTNIWSEVWRLRNVYLESRVGVIFENPTKESELVLCLRFLPRTHFYSNTYPFRGDDIQMQTWSSSHSM